MSASITDVATSFHPLGKDVQKHTSSLGGLVDGSLGGLVDGSLGGLVDGSLGGLVFAYVKNKSLPRSAKLIIIDIIKIINTNPATVRLFDVVVLVSSLS
jgi:hypothetical protein